MEILHDAGPQQEERFPAVNNEDLIKQYLSLREKKDLLEYLTDSDDLMSQELEILNACMQRGILHELCQAVTPDNLL